MRTTGHASATSASLMLMARGWRAPDRMKPEAHVLKLSHWRFVGRVFQGRDGAMASYPEEISSQSPGSRQRRASWGRGATTDTYPNGVPSRVDGRSAMQPRWGRGRVLLPRVRGAAATLGSAR